MSRLETFSTSVVSDQRAPRPSLTSSSWTNASSHSASGDSAAGVSSARTNDSLDSSVEKKRVMIVEDSPDYRVLLKKLFTREGYVVDCASHGQDALTQLSREGAPLPDLILLDLMMPVMDGFEFRAEQVRSATLADIPVVLMTAHGNLQTDPVKLGIRNFVRKPVDMAQLITLVKSAMDKKD